MAGTLSAFDDTLSVNTAEYKTLRYQERRLAQVADYFCYVELAALRYADHEQSPTPWAAPSTQEAIREEVERNLAPWLEKRHADDKVSRRRWSFSPVLFGVKISGPLIRFRIRLMR